jgi:hypothetical protein
MAGECVDNFAPDLLLKEVKLCGRFGTTTPGKDRNDSEAGS